MFKYLSDILSKFTPQQRIIALGLLLFTAVLLGLGNSLIDAYLKSDEVLSDRVRRLELSQSILIKENDSLYNSLSDNQIQCARDIRDVRTKILEDLGVLETQMVSQKRRVSYKVQSQPTQYVDNYGDTVMVSMMQTPQPIQIEDNSEEMIQAIRKLKEKIKNDNQ